MQNGRHSQGPPAFIDTTFRPRHGSDVGSDAMTERGWGSASLSDPSSTRTNNGRADTSTVPADSARSNSDDTLPDSGPIIPYWSAKRHLTCGNPSFRPSYVSKLFPWRGSAPGKLKTANAALVLCLNIDVDPPDVIKTTPCAVLECWVDPHTLPSHKALEAIGTNLQHQFEGLSLKIPYKPILDPSYEDLRRFCMTLRKQAKDDTVCFYYNGHGVPKPTPSGELWCFNRNYTQYIPVSLMEIQGWLGSPGVYIWDCSGAGNLLTNFNTFAERRDQDASMSRGGHPEGMQPYMNSLQLAACVAHEQLPSCPELPADIFTSCLTSPIDIALRYFIMTHQLPNNITPDMVMQLPGDLKDRRTPLGELNWIFTAITDTIAWTTFPRDIFTRLYRSDLLIASLFRNFLLAERIMKNYHCTPHTHPPLPSTNTHQLWAAWDLAVDTCLRQLPDLLEKNTVSIPPTLSPKTRKGQQTPQQQPEIQVAPEKQYQYVPSRFFTDQLTAFEVWISRGGSALTKRGPMSLPVQSDGLNGLDGAGSGMGANGDAASSPSLSQSMSMSISMSTSMNKEHDLVPRKPPDQLPIVLQVLLSQPHRLRALILLSQFVDLGPWAVNLVLTIGIFPYISKLLQAAGQDLRPVLIFIWARILAVDPTVQVDLHNTGGYKYFANVLAVPDDGGPLPPGVAPPSGASGTGGPSRVAAAAVGAALPNSSEHKAMCAFILSAVARDFPNGQFACLRERVFDKCVDYLDEGDFLLRQWSALCIAQIWDANNDIKVYGVDRGTQDKLILLLSDDSPEVRAAALYALGTFMGASGSADAGKTGGGGSGTQNQLDERIHFRMEVAVATGAALAVKDDASPMVRKELLVLISCLVKEWRGYFVICAWIYWEEDRKWRADYAASVALGGAGSALQSHGHAGGQGGQGGHAGGHREEEMTAYAVAEWLDVFDDEDTREENRVVLSSFFTIYVMLLEMTLDPYHEVQALAQTIADYVMALLLESPFQKLACTSLDIPPVPVVDGRSISGGQNAGAGVNGSAGHTRVNSVHGSPSLSNAQLQFVQGQNQGAAAAAGARPGLVRTDSMTSTLSNAASNTIRRTSSFANALRNLAGGIAFPTTEEPRTPSSPASTSSGFPFGGHGYGYGAPSLGTLRSDSASSFTGGGFAGAAGAAQNPYLSRPPSPNLNLATYTSPYAKPPVNLPSNAASSVPSSNGQTHLQPHAALAHGHGRHGHGHGHGHHGHGHHGHGHGRRPNSPAGSSEGSADFLPSHVMEALMEEDLMRLRARRRGSSSPRGRQGNSSAPGGSGGGSSSAHGGASANGSGHSHRGTGASTSGGGHGGGGHGGLNSPVGSTFSIDSTASSVLALTGGCGTGDGLRDVLPLKSSFFEWCCEYFKEPQMRQTEADEPGSVQYNYQVWRQQRNEQVANETQAQAIVAETSRWDRHVAKFNVQCQPLLMAFHSFDSHLVVANESDMVGVWDWSQRRRLSYFCNGNPKGSSITSLHLINQDVGGIIMTGSSDGIIRLFRNYDPMLDQGPLQTVSAFRAIGDPVQVRNGSGLIVDWKQSGGTLLAGGDSRIIRVWDAHTETQVLDLETNHDSSITTMVSGYGSSSTFLTGFADGVVKVFDRRLEEEDAVVRSFSRHHSWVQRVLYHPRFGSQIFSASLDGEVHLWDIRGADRPLQTWDMHQSGLASFDLHPLAGVFGTSSALLASNWRQQSIKIHSISEPTPLLTLPVPTGLTMFTPRHPSPFIPRSTSLVFHPTEMLFGVGQPDGTVRIEGCKLG